MRLSSAPAVPLTLMAILTGFLNPTRMIWSTASLTLALKRPVRLCFGSRPRIFCRSSLKPRSRSRSASSRTSTSNDDCGQWTCGEESSSRRRPGVEIRMFGERLRNVLRSCAGVVAPPRSSCGMTLRVEEGNFGVTWGSSSDFCSQLFITADEGPWNARSERRTLWIWEANSLSQC